jgi:hypothetical protein
MERCGVGKAGQWMSSWCDSRGEYGESDGGGGGAKEGAEGDDSAYKSVGRNPYLKGMKVEERSDMRCRQNADDDERRGLALAGGLQWWPCMPRAESESSCSGRVGCGCDRN